MGTPQRIGDCSEHVVLAAGGGRIALDEGVVVRICVMAIGADFKMYLLR